MFALVMIKIAMELAEEEPDYYNLAMKFFQHFVYIGDALNNYSHLAGNGVGLWDEDDGFFYDALRPVDGRPMVPIKVRSFAGLVPGELAVDRIAREVPALARQRL